MLSAANEVVAQIDQSALAQHFGKRVLEHDKASHASFETQKKALIQALSQRVCPGKDSTWHALNNRSKRLTRTTEFPAAWLMMLHVCNSGADSLVHLFLT